jgi:TonB family protein
MRERATIATFALVVLTTCFVASSATRTVAQTESAPKLVKGVPTPAYPPAATRAGVEGTVEFTASVDADGTVTAVDVLHVPAPDLGFEDSVRAAVRQWRFAAATRAGSVVAGTYHGSVNFQLADPGEWMFSASSHDVWLQLRELVRELKLSTTRMEDDHQLLITRMVNYRRDLPDAQALGLPAGRLPDAIQFHVYVTPGMEPARVAIGTIIQTRSMTNRRDSSLLYENVPASSWLLAKLASRLGAVPEAISSKPARRAEQAQRLMPPGASDACSQKEAVLLTRGAKGVQYPRALSEVKPIYPRNELDDRNQTKLVFSGEITEHGTLTNVVHESPPDASETFKAASQLAARLWRFEPAQIDGCRARLNATFEMVFVLK